MYPGLRRFIPLVGFIVSGLIILVGAGCTALPMNEEASAPTITRLTDDPTDEYAAAWSPDGREIAYTIRDRRGNFDVAVIPATGGKPAFLTTNPTYDGLPSWSPDGEWIAFESDRDFRAGIWVMDRQGGNQRKISRSKDGHFTPTWSPDGEQILYESVPADGDLSKNRELWVMDPSGGQARKLGDGFNPEERTLVFTLGHFHPGSVSGSASGLVLSKPFEVFSCGLSWSPDGRRIAFESVRKGAVSIWVMNRDGSNTVQLTRDFSNNWHPVWSPDGSKIAFASDRAGNYDIWVMNADGSQIRPLTFDAASDFRPSWSPDGRKIVFSSLRSGNSDLWVVDLVL